MGGNQFDHLVQEILRQKQLMDALKAENSELRQQIADLGSGRGIFIDIHGTRFALRDDSSLEQVSHAAPASTSPANSTAAAPTPPVTKSLDQQPRVETPTAEIPQVPFQPQEPSVREPVSQYKNDDDQVSTREDSPFLEELLIDGFANALTSPNATWQGPTEKKLAKPQATPEELINEKQKEALRRELLGSFLLE